MPEPTVLTAPPLPAVPVVVPEPPAIPAPPAPVVPENYTLTPTANSPLDTADVAAVSAYAKAQGMTQEQAAALLKHQETVGTTLRTRYDAAQESERESERSGWIETLKTDKTLGGEHLPETLKRVTLAMDKFTPGADHPYRKMLNETGYGDHPEYIRFVAAIGASLTEDVPPQGGDPLGVAKTLDERLFPNNK